MEKIGVHPLHFAAIMGVNLGLCNVTPPTAPIFYLAGLIRCCKIEHAIKPSLILMYGGMLPVVLINVTGLIYPSFFLHCLAFLNSLRTPADTECSLRRRL